MKNVLVTAAATPLGREMLELLRERDGVEHVVGAEPVASTNWVDGAELVAFPREHGDLVSLLCQYPIDTVVHCGLEPDRSGAGVSPAGAQVVETMRLGAAIASSESPVRAWVIASSSSVYPASSYGPLLHRETGDVDTEEGAQAESIREAEDYARDVAARRPHLNVSLLRLQHLVGEGMHSPMSALLGQPVLPRVIGHDPPIQMLAIDDAVCALAYAAELELAGIYNVASAGTIRMSELIRSLGRPSLPVLPFETGRVLARYADRFGVPHVPPGMLDVLRFGHALDTSKLAAAGFTPERDQESCLDTFRAGR